MIKIIKQEISFDDSLKKKLEFICDFCNTTPKFINGSIRKINKTNLSYLNKANEKSIKLDTYSNKVKDIVNNLKNSFGSKDKYVLTKDDKDKILNYIDNVNDTNNDYKNMKRLSNILNNVDKKPKENRDIINTLTENNEALNLRVNTLTNKLTEKDEEIDDLKKENSSLTNELKK